MIMLVALCSRMHFVAFFIIGFIVWVLWKIDRVWAHVKERTCFLRQFLGYFWYRHFLRRRLSLDIFGKVVFNETLVNGINGLEGSLNRFDLENVALLWVRKSRILFGIRYTWLRWLVFRKTEAWVVWSLGLTVWSIGMSLLTVRWIVDSFILIRSDSFKFLLANVHDRTELVVAFINVVFYLVETLTILSQVSWGLLWCMGGFWLGFVKNWQLWRIFRGLGVWIDGERIFGAKLWLSFYVWGIAIYS